MTTLYELTGRAKEIYEELLHTDDLQLRALLIEELDKYASAIDDKLEAYCIVVKNLTAEAEALNTEAKKLKTRAERVEATKERVMERLKMLVEPGVKWNKGVHGFRWQKSKAVKIINEFDIPTTYMREILKYEPDKKQIAADIACGAVIPGCILEERDNLKII